MIQITFRIARQMMRGALRNGWLRSFRMIFALIALIIVVLGTISASGNIMENYNSTTATLLNITIYLVPLFVLCIGSLTIAGEKEDGSLGLLLTYPVTAAQVTLGMFSGLSSAFFSTIALSMAFPAVLMIFVGMIGNAIMYFVILISCIVLMFDYLAIALLIGIRSENRIKAIGNSLAVWFVSIIIFEPAVNILCMLVPRTGVIPILTASVAMNPADSVRFMSILLMGSESVLGTEMYSLITFAKSPLGIIATVLLQIVYISLPIFITWRFMKRIKK